MATPAPTRHLSHYPPTPRPRLTADSVQVALRFNSHLRVGPTPLSTPCTIFDAAVFHPTTHGPSISPNRWAWTQSIGPIPAGLLLVSYCRTPRCVDPAHHYLATPSQIARTRKPPHTGRRGRYLTEDQVVEVRRLAASGMRQWKVGEVMGISQAQVSAIVTRRAWAKVG